MNTQEVERQIVEKLLDDALTAGLSISVHDGEEFPLRNSTNKAAILEAMFSTDADGLHFSREGKPSAWVLLIYGNGPDLISDSTTKNTEFLVGAEALAEELEPEWQP